MAWCAIAYFRQLLDEQQLLGPYRGWKLAQGMGLRDVPYVTPSANGVLLPPSEKQEVFLHEQINLAWEALDVEKAIRTALLPLVASHYFALMLCDLLWLHIHVSILNSRIPERDDGGGHQGKSKRRSGPRISSEVLEGYFRHYHRVVGLPQLGEGSDDVGVDHAALQTMVQDIANVDLDDESCALLLSAIMDTPPSASLFRLETHVPVGAQVSQPLKKEGSHASPSVVPLPTLVQAVCHPVVDDVPSEELTKAAKLLEARAARWACLLQTSIRPHSEEDLRLHTGHATSQRLAAFTTSVLNGMIDAVWGRTGIDLTATTQQIVNPLITGAAELTAPMRIVPSRVLRAPTKPHATAPAAKRALVRPATASSSSSKNAAASLLLPGAETVVTSASLAGVMLGQEMNALFPKSARRLLPDTNDDAEVTIKPKGANDWVYQPCIPTAINAHSTSAAISMTDLARRRHATQVLLTPRTDDTLARRHLHVSIMGAQATKRATRAVERYEKGLSATAVQASEKRVLDHLSGEESLRASQRLAVAKHKASIKDGESNADTTVQSVRASVAQLLNFNKADVSRKQLETALAAIPTLRAKLHAEVPLKHVRDSNLYWQVSHEIEAASRQLSNRIRFARLEGIV